MLNVKLRIADPDDHSVFEEQIYSNRNGLYKNYIRKRLFKKVSPNIGNFPHMAGANKPVIITKVFNTYRDNNTGIDISEILEKLDE